MLLSNQFLLENRLISCTLQEARYKMIMFHALNGFLTGISITRGLNYIHFAFHVEKLYLCRADLIFARLIN